MCYTVLYGDARYDKAQYELGFIYAPSVPESQRTKPQFLTRVYDDTEPDYVAPIVETNKTDGTS